jgi:phosphoribosylglycinamide formyltransferase 1
VPCMIVARLGVLVSGEGTNLQAILDAAAEPGFPAQVVVVVADRDGIGALGRAERAGVESVVVRLEDFADRDAFTRAVAEHLRSQKVDTVATAGWMKLLAPPIFEHYRGRILNTHPSLLPAFPGPGGRALREQIEWGVKQSGVTIHFLDEELDHGPIVFQEAVPVEEDDTPETLHERLKTVEHRLFPLAIRLLAEGRLAVEGRRVRIRSR